MSGSIITQYKTAKFDGGVGDKVGRVGVVILSTDQTLGNNKNI